VLADACGAALQAFFAERRAAARAARRAVAGNPEPPAPT
jgi:hypothetical protein